MYKILMHLLFLDFLHERSLIIDIQIVISLAFETSYKLQTIKQGCFSFYERNRFSPEDKIFKALLNICDLFAKQKATEDDNVVNLPNIFYLSDYFLNF